MKQIKPLADRIVIEQELMEETSKGGIILPSTVTKEKPTEGTVLAKGAKVSTDIKLGDKVFFKKWANDEIEVEGKKFLLVKEEDVLAVMGGKK